MNKTSISNRAIVYVVFILIIVLAIVVFRVILPQEAVLFSTDNNIGNEGHEKSLLPHGFIAQWSDFPFIGSGG